MDPRTGRAARRRPSPPRMTPAYMLCAAALLALPLSPGAATAVPRSAPAADVVVVDCFTKPQVRPADFLLACGDGNNRLTGLHWTSWGPRSATGTGTDLVNDCVPYCAAGTFRSYPVTVTLSRPEPWPREAGVLHFTRLRLAYTGAAPAPLPSEVTYRLWN
ncbi:hypothetical protein ACIRSU_00020 [Streptomyces sp. NPDC101160]|uniref:hypothetical protein n=1 Tax=Streptomyces sp. NPDC101160 TaxID=3366118 RepID=UPI0037FEA393